MPGAGQLRERIRFESQALASDGYGNEVGESWGTEFTVAARVMFLRGGEDVMAARLSGRQPVVITVRQSSETLQIQPEWRAVNVNSGAIYQIKAPPANMDEKNAFLDILAEQGIAA